MTGRTSSLHGRTQNPIAFRVDIDLPKIAYAAYSLPELVEKAPAKQSQMHQFNASIAQPRHLAATVARLASRFPHRAQPTPAASS